MDIKEKVSKVIPFSPPDISDLEIKEVVEALRSGWITTGPRTKLLERRLAAFIETGKTDIDCNSDDINDLIAELHSIEKDFCESHKIDIIKGNLVKSDNGNNRK